MIYPENAVDKLGFTDIKELIKAKCLTVAGKALVDKIQPQRRLDQLDRFLRQTHEFRELRSKDAALRVDRLCPVKPLAEKACVEGGFLSDADFLTCLLPLKTVYAIIRYFNERSGRCPNPEVLFEHLPMEWGIVR